MATRTVELSEETAELLAAGMESGEFTDADAAISEGLGMLELRSEMERLRVDKLQELVAEAEEDFAKGDFVTVNSRQELEALTAGIFESAKRKTWSPGKG